MAVVAVMALLFWVGIQWKADTGSTRGVGHTSVPLVFVVSDIESGRPIDGATIKLSDHDYQSNQVPPYVLQLKTGKDGQASTQVDLMFYESRGIPSGQLRLFRVAYPHWEIRVAADGYEDAIAPFADYEQRDRRFHENAPPPPIAIRLRRQPQMVGSRGKQSEP
jgi:hypothetical protein